MLHRCLLLSLSLHLLMLVGGERLHFPNESTAGQMVAKVIVHLKSAPQAAMPHVTGMETAPDTSVLPSRPVKPRSLTVPSKSVAPGSSSPNGSTRTSQETGAAEKAHPPLEAMSGGSSGHQTKAPEEPEAPSADGLRQYRLMLAREARRFKRYPAYARERGWEGDVIILLAGASVLDTPSVSLEKSSGHAVLDEQALDIMRSAVSLATLPESLRGKKFRITVPIQFRLDD